jgi:hypothetical protein
LTVSISFNDEIRERRVQLTVDGEENRTPELVEADEMKVLGTLKLGRRSTARPSSGFATGSSSSGRKPLAHRWTNRGGARVPSSSE